MAMSTLGPQLQTASIDSGAQNSVAAIHDTPWRMNILNPKNGGFGADDFPFLLGDFLGSSR